MGVLLRAASVLPMGPCAKCAATRPWQYLPPVLCFWGPSTPLSYSSVICSLCQGCCHPYASCGHMPCNRHLAVSLPSNVLTQALAPSAVILSERQVTVV